MSACIALVAILLKHPSDVRARSHLGHIGDFVKFLTKVQQREDLDVERMLCLCTQFQKIVLDTIPAETDVLQSAVSGCYPSPHAKAQVSPGTHRWRRALTLTPQQRLASQLAFYGNHMQLAQGLMGNMPTLQALAANVFFDLLPVEQQVNSSIGILAPALLNPETYQFAFTQAFSQD